MLIGLLLWYCFGLIKEFEKRLWVLWVEYFLPAEDLLEYFLPAEDLLLLDLDLFLPEVIPVGLPTDPEERLEEQLLAEAEWRRFIEALPAAEALEQEEVDLEQAREFAIALIRIRFLPVQEVRRPIQLRLVNIEGVEQHLVVPNWRHPEELIPF